MTYQPSNGMDEEKIHENPNPAPQHARHIVGAVFLCLVGVALVLGAMFGVRYPRIVAVVNDIRKTQEAILGAATATTSTAQTPWAAAPVNTSTYDARLLQIANLPTVTITTTTRISATSTATTTVTFSKTLPSPWPVKTTYPNAGALLPYDRIVAYYGNFYSTQMGVLGQYPPDDVMRRLASTTALWQAADPATPVIPAIDYIAVTAQASAGSDGMYRARMPASQIQKAIDMANQMNGVVFLDVQVGLSTVEKEVPLLAQYLKLPQVHLSLDPEFAMHGGVRPGTVIGTMDAADINWAAHYLANLVRENGLPPKILVVHRFTEDMVTNYRSIQPLPEVQIVMDMDGFGFAAKKINTYARVIVPEPVQFTGFKLFYKNDAIPSIAGSDHMMTPQEVLKLSPQPSYIQYQ